MSDTDSPPTVPSPERPTQSFASKRSGTGPFARGTFGLAAVCVGWCVLLLLAGANVRTQRAGLTVPDWPLIWGELVPGWDGLKELYRIDRLRAEVVHRHIAGVMGLLTLALALRVQFQGRGLLPDGHARARRWAWGAFVLVVVQAVFGGVGVLELLAPPWPLLHSVFAQVFLCTLVVVAALVSPRRVLDVRRPFEAVSLPVIRGSALSIVALLVQLLLGAAARHGYLPREVHSMFALVVVVLLAKLVLTGAGDTPQDLVRIRRPCRWIGAVTIAQVVLGLMSYLIATERAVRDEQGLQDLPTLAQIATLNVHLVLGATLLALSLTVFLRAVRVWGLPTDERVASVRAAASETA